MLDNVNSNKCVNVKTVRDVMYINGNKYIVNTFFSKKSAETVTKKLERLILNEALKNI